MTRMFAALRSCQWCARSLFACECGKGGGSTTTVVQTTIPGKTETELALEKEQLEATKLQNQLFREQVGELRKQNETLAETIPAQKALFTAQTKALTGLADLQERQFKLQEDLLDQAFTETPAQKEIREASEARALAFVRGEAPPVTPGQSSRLETIFSERRTEGEEEIQRFAEELAGIRGLNLSDTPIGGEAIRAKERLERGLQSGRAEAELNIEQADRIFSENLRQFSEGLKQQAFMNRLALAGSPAAGGTLPIGGGRLPVTTSGPFVGPANVAGILDVMSRERLGQARTKATETYSPGFFDYYSTTLGAIGGAVGSYYGAQRSGSSATLKRDILPLDLDEYDRALQRVRETPIVRYRYKWERDDARAPHIGPIAELSPDEIRDGPILVNLLDYSGLLHAGLKAVDRRLQRVEGREVGPRRRLMPLPIGGDA